MLPDDLGARCLGELGELVERLSASPAGRRRVVDRDQVGPLGLGRGVREM